MIKSAKSRVVLSGILIIVLIAKATTAQLTPFSNLNDNDKESLIESASGCMAPSTINPGMLKGMFEIKSKLGDSMKTLITRITTLVPAASARLSELSTNLTTTIDKIDSFDKLLNLRDSIVNIVTQYSTQYSITALASGLNLINLYEPIFQTVNDDAYKPNLNDHVALLNDIEAKFSAETWYTAIKNSLTQAQLNALALVVEIPNDLSKADLIARVGRVLNGRKALPTELEQLISTPTNKLSAAQLATLEPIIKDMTCFYLKKMDARDFIINWLFAKQKISTAAISKLCRCNMNLLAILNDTAASQSFNLATLDPNVRSVISDNIIKYMMKIGFRDSIRIIDYLGPLMLNVPSATLETLLNSNIQTIALCFAKYNVKAIFFTLSKEWRQVVAKAVMKYLNSLSRVFVTSEIDMLATVITDVSFEAASSLLDANNNYQQVMIYTDSITDQVWLSNRDICEKYFTYLAIKAKTDATVTIARLKKLVKCKQSCDFSKAIEGKSTADIIAFAKETLPAVDQNVVCSCKSVFGSYLKNCAAKTCTAIEVAQVLGGWTIPSCVAFSASELPLAIRSALISSNVDLDELTSIAVIRSLANIKTLSLAQLKYVLKGITLDEIKSRTDSEVYGILDDVIRQCPDMKPENLVLLLSKALKHAQSLSTLKAAILKIINTAKAAKCFDGIDVAQFNAASLVPTKQALVTALTPSTSDSFSINAALLSDLKNFQNLGDLFETIVKLKVDGANEFRLTRIAEAIFKYFQNQNIQLPWSLLTDAHVDQIDAKIFLALERTNLTQILSVPAFATLLKKIARIDAPTCLDFSVDKVRIVIDGAFKLLNLETKATLDANDLDMIGPFLAARLPVKHLKKIEAGAFLARIHFFKSKCFSLTVADASEFANYLAAVLKALPGTSVSKLEELVIYLLDADLGSFSKTDLATYAQAILKSIKEKKDSKASADVSNDQKISGLKLEDINNQQDSIKRVVAAILKVIQNANLSGRKKRQASTLTCSTITDVTSGGYYASTVYSPDELTSLSPAEFESCLIYFGDEANYWPDSYITAFYQNIKLIYRASSSIPSTVITDLGIIAYKFSTSELSQLNLSSDSAISSLGKLSAFTADQYKSLVSAVKSSGLTVTSAGTLKISGNLVCGLSSSEVSSSSAAFNDALGSLSLISTTNCGNIADWWGLFKQATSASGSFTPENLAKAGSLAAGMTVSEFNANMNSIDQGNALSANALKIMSTNADLKAAMTASTIIMEGLDPTQKSSFGVYDKSTTTLLQSDARFVNTNGLLVFVALFSLLFIF